MPNHFPSVLVLRVRCLLFTLKCNCYLMDCLHGTFSHFCGGGLSCQLFYYFADLAGLEMWCWMSLVFIFDDDWLWHEDCLDYHYENSETCHMILLHYHLIRRNWEKIFVFSIFMCNRKKNIEHSLIIAPASRQFVVHLFG